jgi:hypothetical protein
MISDHDDGDGKRVDVACSAYVCWRTCEIHVRKLNDSSGVDVDQDIVREIPRIDTIEAEIDVDHVMNW